MTAFWGDGQRSEWRYQLTPEQLRAVEEREKPRLDAARAAREARRQAAREQRRIDQDVAESHRLDLALEEFQQRYTDNHKLCGGKTRKDGSPCRSIAIRPNGRCKWHGGLSTGPTTPEGLEHMREAKRQYWELWRAAGRPKRQRKPHSAEGRANISAGLRRRSAINRLQRLAEQLRSEDSDAQVSG